MTQTLNTLLITTLLSIPAVFAGGVIESKESESHALRKKVAAITEEHIPATLEGVMGLESVAGRITGLVTTPKKDSYGGIPEFQPGFSGLKDLLTLKRVSSGLKYFFSPTITPEYAYFLSKSMSEIKDMKSEAMQALKTVIDMGDPKYAWYAASSLLQVERPAEVTRKMPTLTDAIYRLSIEEVRRRNRDLHPIGIFPNTVKALVRVVDMRDPQYALAAAKQLLRMRDGKKLAEEALSRIVDMGNPEYAFEAANYIYNHNLGGKFVSFEGSFGGFISNPRALKAFLKIVDMGQASYAYKAAEKLAGILDPKTNLAAIVSFKKVADMNDVEHSPKAVKRLNELAMRAGVSVDELVARAQKEIAAEADVDPLPSATAN